jgi:hypothetical protein
VQERYLGGSFGDMHEESCRHEIVKYMKHAAVSPGRKYDELPHQLFELYETRRYDKRNFMDSLYNFLLDFDVFDYLYNKDWYKLGKYWRALQEESKKDYPFGKFASLDDTGKSKETLLGLFSKLGIFAADTLGDYSASLEFNLKALNMGEEFLGKNHPKIQKVRDNIEAVLKKLEKKE